MIDNLLVRCENDNDVGLTKGNVYEIKTYSSLYHWKAPVIGVINDEGLLTIYASSIFSIVENDDE